MSANTLEQSILTAGGPLQLLRNQVTGEYPFPIPPEVTNWRDEQRKWVHESILYDISAFGADVYFRGPDVRRLLSDTAVNDFSSFGRNKAKQLIAVNYDGYMIDDAIIFGLEDDEYVTVGSPMAANWIAFQAQLRGGYDVSIQQDQALAFGGSRKRYFRFIVQGPTALAAIRKAAEGTLPEIKFFRIGEFAIAGKGVRALNHTMSGLPGRDDTGLEIYGPSEFADEVKAALLAAGRELGLQEGGAVSYPTCSVESGWLGMPVPAIYAGDEYRAYREWLGADSWEATTSLGGSFVSENIADYYVTPWELGYGRAVNFNHDFVGKEGLLRRREDQARQKVWLMWNNEDVARVIASSLFEELPAKYLAVPTPNYSGFNYDALVSDGRTVGWSGWAGYTTNMKSFASLAVVERGVAKEGTEVTLIWGEPNGRSTRPRVERHKQTQIRATVRTSPPVGLK